MWQQANDRMPSMVVGVNGVNGLNVLVRAGLVFPFNLENAITLHQNIVGVTVLEKERGLNCAILMYS